VLVWREHRGMTQQKLAEAAGISKAYLSQIEAEVRGGSVAVLSKLAKALSVDLDDLVAPQR
jgi:transcriptional regulator with XRE-family HTH domain